MTLAGPVAIDGFAYSRIAVGDSTYVAGLAGQGPPVLLLHGFPQNQYCWHRIAPALAPDRTVVVCDLKGYGASRAPSGGSRGEGYSKRQMSAELVEVMARLGHDRFAVVGHDRGGRVAYRMALDSPHCVERLCVLNIVPTIDQFERMAGGPSLGYWPWFLLALPAPFPEQLITAAPEQFLRFIIFDTWTAEPGVIDEDAFCVYLDAFAPAAAAICGDYRASFWLDREHDEDDRRSRRRIECRRSSPPVPRRRSSQTGRCLAGMGARRSRDDRPGRSLHPRGSARLHNR